MGHRRQMIEQLIEGEEASRPPFETGDEYDDDEQVDPFDSSGGTRD